MKPTEPEPEKLSAVDRAAEEKLVYTSQAPNVPNPPLEEGVNGAAKPTPIEEARSPTDAPDHHAPSGPEDAAYNGHATPAAPNLYDAALALNACLPDGEKVERDLLPTDAARELGYPKLTSKVRHTLNQALSA